jgi:hypothetical protein
MKASILISGGINGNHTLSASLLTIGASQKYLSFGQILVKYDSVKEARTALKSAYQELKGETRCQFSQYTGKLHYDNSTAVLRKGF